MEETRVRNPVLKVTSDWHQVTQHVYRVDALRLFVMRVCADVSKTNCCSYYAGDVGRDVDGRLVGAAEGTRVGL